MRPLPDAVPLSAHRDSLQRYLGQLDFTFDSVAGRIIAERFPAPRPCDAVRPTLLLWACAANGAPVDDALPVAAAFELFERFMHLHAELVDEAAPSVARWGLGQSLNGGDALYALAFRSLSSDVRDPARRLRAARLVGEGVLAAISHGPFSREGRCALGGVSMEAGALIAGATDGTAQRFAAAGRALALAGDCPDSLQARRHAEHSISLLRAHATAADLDAYCAAARYVARHAA